MSFTRLQILAAALMVLPIATPASGQNVTTRRSAAPSIPAMHQLAELTGSDEQQYCSTPTRQITMAGTSLSAAGITSVVGAPYGPNMSSNGRHTSIDGEQLRRLAQCSRDITPFSAGFVRLRTDKRFFRGIRSEQYVIPPPLLRCVLYGPQCHDVFHLRQAYPPGACQDQ